RLVEMPAEPAEPQLQLELPSTSAPPPLVPFEPTVAYEPTGHESASADPPEEMTVAYEPPPEEHVPSVPQPLASEPAPAVPLPATTEPAAPAAGAGAEPAANAIEAPPVVRRAAKRSMLVPTLLIFLIPYSIFSTIAVIVLLNQKFATADPLERMLDESKKGSPKR